jgi:hypothetical protein
MGDWMKKLTVITQDGKLSTEESGKAAAGENTETGNETRDEQVLSLTQRVLELEERLEKRVTPIGDRIITFISKPTPAYELSEKHRRMYAAVHDFYNETGNTLGFVAKGLLDMAIPFSNTVPVLLNNYVEVRRKGHKEKRLPVGHLAIIDVGKLAAGVGVYVAIRSYLG